MSRLSTITALAAIALFAGAASGPAAAADSDDDYSYQKSYKQRPVANDYDEDAYGGRDRNNGRWNNDGWGGHTYIRRVEARASYSGDYAPYYMKEWRAKRSAIEAWKLKVSRLYGERFAHWRAASDKNVSCDGGAGTIYCTASARPQRGWQRWGWYGSRD